MARPCDVELDQQGFRVIGGSHAGVHLTWDELDVSASGVRDGAALAADELVAATRDGKLVPVAEGEELDSSVFTLALLRGSLSLLLTLYALAAPLLLTILLALVASLVVSRRVAVRAVALDFAAVAPTEPGKPCACRVCGAPLPQLDAPVLRCAYCSSSNILSSARPRAPSHVQDQAKSLEDTLEAQRSEQLVRVIFLTLAGLPALWGAWAALRFLWHPLS